MNDKWFAKREKGAEDISDFSNPHGRTTFQLLAPERGGIAKAMPLRNADCRNVFAGGLVSFNFDRRFSLETDLAVLALVTAGCHLRGLWVVVMTRPRPVNTSLDRRS